MKIFPQEKDLISQNNNNVVTAECVIDTKEAPKFATAGAESLVAALRPSAINEDSFWLPSILVTTNWNSNDDVFTPEETWSARNTPVNKPVNWMHNAGGERENEIIGVINSSRVVDTSYNIVEGVDGLQKFHIAVGMVIWQKYFPDYAEKIVAGVSDDSLHVSMECLFDDFAYAIQEVGSNDISLLERTEKTAGLTRFLRAYKGAGRFKTETGREYKIGRWLKKITFSGVGCVYRPANKESIILSDIVRAETNPNFAAASTDFFEIVTAGVLDNDQKGEIMADNKTQANDSMDEKMKTMCEQVEAMKKEMAETKATLATITAEKEALASEKAKVEAMWQKEKAELVAAKEAEAKEAEAKITEASTALATANAKLEDIEKTAKASERVAKLKAVNAVEDEAAALAEVKDMDEKAFASVLAFATASMKKSTSVTETGMPKATEQTKTGLTKSTEAAEKVLESAKADETDRVVDATLATAAANVNSKAEQFKLLSDFAETLVKPKGRSTKNAK